MIVLSQRIRLFVAYFWLQHKYPSEIVTFVAQDSTNKVSDTSVLNPRKVVKNKNIDEQNPINNEQYKYVYDIDNDEQSEMDSPLFVDCCKKI